MPQGHSQTIYVHFLFNQRLCAGYGASVKIYTVLLEGVYMTPGRLSPRSEFTPVPSHGSIFVYMIPPQNVMLVQVTPAWVHPGSCTGARISLRYEISQRYHVNVKRSFGMKSVRR